MADNIEERINADGTVRFRVRVEMKGHKRLSATFPNKTKAKL